MTEQAVILVGGKGTRLGTITETIPKPLIQVGENPFLDLLIKEFVRHGMRDIILLAGHLGERVVERYAEREVDGCSIRVVVEEEPAGTGGALRHAANYLHDTFFLANGDSVFDFNYLDLVTQDLSGPWVGKMALRPLKGGSRYGAVTAEGSLITGFSEKNSDLDGECMNAGVYVLRKSILDYMGGASFCSLERDVFPQLVSEGLLRGYSYDGLFVDIGVPEDLEWARCNLLERLRKPAVFLDRDGVLNKDSGYVHSPEDFEWVPGAPQAVKRLNDQGYYVFVVTNQAGVAKGYYGEEAVLTLHAWMNEQLRSTGAHIDDYFYCPHHPEGVVEALRVDCPCRKPRPGMLHRALERWPVDLQGSFLVGDKESDIEAAKQARIPGYLFDGGSLDLFCFPIVRDLAGGRDI